MACGSSGATPIVSDPTGSCVEVAVRIPLPPELAETSGVAFGRRDPAVLWTHNDSGDDPVVYAVAADGLLLGSVAVTGAEAVDWEDMEIADCQAGSCLYLADVGDNPEVRTEIVVYRIPEPAAADDRSAPAAALRMAYPDGPHDAEGMFVLPGERLYVVTKGRSGPAALYRYPGPLRPGELVTLERVQDVSASRPAVPDQITGASASADGGVVALRSYVGLSLYTVLDDRLDSEPVLSQSLRTLQERQGEAVGLGPDQLIALTTEGAGDAPSLSTIRCTIAG